MKRVLVAGALATAASLLVVSPASADPAACLDVSIDVNGTGQVQHVCLPPEGGSTPGIPGLPSLR
jgi:hypothetical protein